MPSYRVKKLSLANCENVPVDRDSVVRDHDYNDQSKYAKDTRHEKQRSCKPGFKLTINCLFQF